MIFLSKSSKVERHSLLVLTSETGVRSLKRRLEGNQEELAGGGLSNWLGIQGIRK